VTYHLFSFFFIKIYKTIADSCIVDDELTCALLKKTILRE